jgi:hypothetical protein
MTNKMKLFIICIIHLFLSSALLTAQSIESMNRSIKSFGVLPENSPEINKVNLQKAIDWAAKSGAALFVEPSEDPYFVSGGIILRKNVSLLGVNGPVPRATRHPEKMQPVGSVFAILDTISPFITVESSTQIRGIQFWYPEQSMSDPSKIITYPPTIQVSHTSGTEGVTLSDLTFYGEYISMDFNCRPPLACELILIEHCHGYPLSGEFIRIDYCYDIPRILHCHVNPAIQRQLGGMYSKAIIDAVVARQKFTYSINHTDNAEVMDVFTFGNYGGIRLGEATYGQLTNFNFDCVTVGIYKSGDNSKNRNWMIAQGSIIANTGSRLEDVHPFIIEGKGHTSISNVEAFSGDNPVLTNFGMSWDYMTVRGSDKCTVSLSGCRMRDYKSDSPFTVSNRNAVIQATGCLDKKEEPFNIISDTSQKNQSSSPGKNR